MPVILFVLDEAYNDTFVAWCVELSDLCVIGTRAAQYIGFIVLSRFLCISIQN